MSGRHHHGAESKLRQFFPLPLHFRAIDLTAAVSCITAGL